MADTHINRLRTTVSAVASAGLGAFTISTASSGYRTFAAGQDGQTFTVLVTEGTTWEVNTGCAYTHAGTSLARGTLADSSTGSAITFTSAAVVTVVAAAGFGNKSEAMMQAITPGGRLTLESGVPISTTDQTAKTSVYYTPYIHNIVNLWDGANWTPTTFTEKTLALGTLTSGKNYDVFGYLSSGALVLESLAWSTDTARTTDVTLQDGRYCKSGDKTRLYLGTFRTTSTTTTEDSGAVSTTAARKRFVWNAYNRVKRGLNMEEDTASWTYSTASTWRQWRASSDNQVEAVVGLPGAAVISLEINGVHARDLIGGSSTVAIGYDSTTAFSGDMSSSYNAGYSGSSGIPYFVHARVETVVAIGYHYWAMLEATLGTGALTAYGTNSVSRRPAIVGWVEA